MRTLRSRPDVIETDARSSDTLTRTFRSLKLSVQLPQHPLRENEQQRWRCAHRLRSGVGASWVGRIYGRQMGAVKVENFGECGPQRRCCSWVWPKAYGVGKINNAFTYVLSRCDFRLAFRFACAMCAVTLAAAERKSDETIAAFAIHLLPTIITEFVFGCVYIHRSTRLCFLKRANRCKKCEPKPTYDVYYRCTL